MQERSLYPKLLHLLRPYSGPARRPSLIVTQRAPSSSWPSAEPMRPSLYGSGNLAVSEDWLMGSETQNESVGVRVITAAPEVDGVMASIEELTRRGIVFSMGHR